MNFPAWPGQSSVRPMFVENSVLPIFPDEPAAAQICAASAPLSGPTVFFVKPWTINPPDASPASAAILLISLALPIPTLRPPSLNQRCFVSVSPRRIFLPGLNSPSSSPCSSKNLRYQFSPTNQQLHKSALPILPPVGMAAAAPMSGPTVFFVKPWTIQSV